MPYQIDGYFLHLAAGLAMLGLFARVYTWITPYNELALIRGGSMAAALSLVGAMGGFALTLASSMVYSASFTAFCLWALLAATMQLAAYAVIARLVPSLPDDLANNNQAVGALLGGTSLIVGIINAACLS